ELEPVLAGYRKSSRGGIDSDEAARPQVDLVAVDQHAPRAPDDEVHLLLPLLGVVVLAALLVRRQDEVVEAERTCTDGTARLADHPAGPFAFDLVHVDDVVRSHRRGLYCSRPSSSRLANRSAKALRRVSPETLSW